MAAQFIHLVELFQHDGIRHLECLVVVRRGSIQQLGNGVVLQTFSDGLHLHLTIGIVCASKPTGQFVIHHTVGIPVLLQFVEEINPFLLLFAAAKDNHLHDDGFPIQQPFFTHIAADECTANQVFVEGLCRDMTSKNRTDLGRHHLADITLDERAILLWQTILLHVRLIVIILVFHVSLQHIQQRELQLLFLRRRVSAQWKEQYYTLLLPCVFDGIFGVEPCAIKNLIYISVSPFLPLQVRLKDVHPVEDEEHMKLRVALKVAIYSILYHFFLS